MSAEDLTTSVGSTTSVSALQELGGGLKKGRFCSFFCFFLSILVFGKNQLLVSPIGFGAGRRVEFVFNFFLKKKLSFLYFEVSVTPLPLGGCTFHYRFLYINDVRKGVDLKKKESKKKKTQNTP